MSLHLDNIEGLRKQERAARLSGRTYRTVSGLRQHVQIVVTQGGTSVCLARDGELVPFAHRESNEAWFDLSSARDRAALTVTLALDLGKPLLDTSDPSPLDTSDTSPNGRRGIGTSLRRHNRRHQASNGATGERRTRSNPQRDTLDMVVSCIASNGAVRIDAQRLDALVTAAGNTELFVTQVVVPLSDGEIKDVANLPPDARFGRPLMPTELGERCEGMYIDLFRPKIPSWKTSVDNRDAEATDKTIVFARVRKGGRSTSLHFPAIGHRVDLQDLQPHPMNCEVIYGYTPTSVVVITNPADTQHLAQLIGDTMGLPRQCETRRALEEHLATSLSSLQPSDMVTLEAQELTAAHLSVRASTSQPLPSAWAHPRIARASLNLDLEPVDAMSQSGSQRRASSSVSMG